MRVITFSFLLLGSLFPFLTSAQEARSPLRVGLGWTGMMYTGDLTVDENDYLRMYPGGNLSLQFANNRAFRIRANTGFGKVVEQWDLPSNILESNPISNSYFETNIFYIDFRLMRYFLRDKKVQPYVGIGPSLFFFNPKDKDGNFLIDNIFTRENGEEFATTTIVFPTTAGVHIPLSRVLGVSVDYTYRLNVSDYIDNIGLLGENPGRDRLHALQLSLDINLGIRPESQNPADSSKKINPILAVLTGKGFQLRKKLDYRKIKPDHHNITDQRVKEEADRVLYYEMSPSAEIPASSVYSRRSAENNLALEQHYWQQMKKYVFENNIFSSVQMEGTISMSGICDIYHLSMDELRQLNPKIKDPIKDGTFLKLPDYKTAKRRMEKSQN